VKQIGQKQDEATASSCNEVATMRQLPRREATASW